MPDSVGSVSSQPVGGREAGEVPPDSGSGIWPPPPAAALLSAGIAGEAAGIAVMATGGGSEAGTQAAEAAYAMLPLAATTGSPRWLSLGLGILAVSLGLNLAGLFSLFFGRPWRRKRD